MTKEQIDKLMDSGKFPEPTQSRELIETHISWVIISDRFVYKIKKPVRYSFLDFSTPARRKYYCEREIQLNRRLTSNIYIDVQPICESEGKYRIGGDAGNIIDHAVRMHKLDRNRQMDALLLRNDVSATDIRNLAEKIALFHKQTTIIFSKDLSDIRQQFNDLEAEREFLQDNIGMSSSDIISNAIHVSDQFVNANKELLSQRLEAGYVRDCHGDLHSRNIFLLPDPQPFDCIEFNDDFRQIDILNEVAFLCMDLDAFNRQDLSDLFIRYYNEFLPSISTEAERRLFVYYKSYRANVRAKVNSLRAKSAGNEPGKTSALSNSDRYLKLMDSYISSLK